MLGCYFTSALSTCAIICHHLSDGDMRQFMLCLPSDGDTVTHSYVPTLFLTMAPRQVRGSGAISTSRPGTRGHPEVRGHGVRINHPGLCQPQLQVKNNFIFTLQVF